MKSRSQLIKELKDYESEAVLVTLDTETLERMHADVYDEPETTVRGNWNI